MAGQMGLEGRCHRVLVIDGARVLRQIWLEMGQLFALVGEIFGRHFWRAGGRRVGERNRTRKMAFVKSNVRLLGFIARKIEATDVERFVLLISFDEGPFCQW